MNTQAPSPGQVLDSLVEQFAPPYDPTLPFHDPKRHAKRRLAAKILIEAYGPAHPLSVMVQNYMNYEHRLTPSEELCEEIHENMQEAWESLSEQVSH